MEARDLASALVTDPYSDRFLVDEATHRSLALCKAVIGIPTTDLATRTSCLAKCVSLLDALPKVRAFDSRATREYNEKQRAEAGASSE
ncbi:hypothetical protein IWW38_005297, partial [Coemansia aciculifera]